MSMSERERAQGREPTDTTEAARAPEWCLAGDSEMAALMRAVAWEGSALGPVRAWPTSLKTMVGVVLANRVRTGR